MIGVGSGLVDDLKSKMHPSSFKPDSGSPPSAPSSRDDSGRFLPGGPGGPGRPRRTEDRYFTHDELLTLSKVEGHELYLAAVAMQERKEWVDKIPRQFPPEIAAKIEKLVILADLAQDVIMRRLVKELRR